MIKKKSLGYLLSFFCILCFVFGFGFINTNIEKASADSGNSLENIYFNTVSFRIDSFAVRVELSTSSRNAELQRDKYNHMVIFYGETAKVEQVKNACATFNFNDLIDSGVPFTTTDSGTFNYRVSKFYGVNFHEIPLNALSDNGNTYRFATSFNTSDKDMAFFCYFYYCSSFRHTPYGISNVKSVNFEETFTSWVEHTDGKTQDQLRLAHRYFGKEYSDDKTVNVRVKYFEMTDYFSYEERSISVGMNWLYYRDKDYAWNYLLNTLDLTLSNFDCKHNDFDYLNGGVINTYQKPIRTAKGYNFTIDNECNVDFEIVYGDFTYNDLFMCLKYNSLDNNLSMFVYNSFVNENADTYDIIFNFADIERWAYSSSEWFFELKKENIKILGVEKGVSISYLYENLDSNECSGVCVTVQKNAVNNLFGLSIYAVAAISIDYDYDCAIEYIHLKKDLTTEILNTETFVLNGNSLKILNNRSFEEDEEYKDYMDIVNNALEVKGFMKYSGIQISSKSREDVNDPNSRGSAIIKVQYTYKTCVVIKNNINDNCQYFFYTGVNPNYTLKDFGIATYENYRVSDVYFNGGESRIIFNRNEGNIFDSQIKFNTQIDELDPIELNVVYSNEWPVNIYYLQPYNKNVENTPFAQKVVVQKNISVSEFGDIDSLTTSDIAQLLGFESLNILKSSADTLPTITYNENTQSYDIVVTYSFVSVSKLGIDGEKEELKVPLTCYADWLALNGQNFSILWLNTKEKEYFKYSNEISPEDLYGYFAVAVFAEKQVSLNHILRNEQGEGCPVLYSSKETTGSGFYKFMSDTDLAFAVTGGSIGLFLGNPIVGVAVGSALKYGILACCEIAEDNRLLYTYMFYYDGFTSEPFISTSGAKDAFDTGSSTENSLEKIGDTVSDFWGNLKDKSFFKVVRIALILICTIFVINIVIRLITWIFPRK